MTERTGESGTLVDIDPPCGRDMLSWEGKHPLRHLPAPPARLVEMFAPLQHVSRRVSGPTLDPGEISADSQGNHLFLGDNRPVLAHLLANGFRGQVDLVYIDPPFDSGTNYVRRVQLRGAPPAQATQAARLVGETYSLGEQIQYSDIWTHDNYLQFMYERLLLLRELLSTNGSIYVHMDSHRSHAIKLICDEVFGPDRFQREIVWRIGWVSGFKSRVRNWIRNHDTILFYTKADTGRLYFNKEYIPYPTGYTRRDGSPPSGPGYPIEDTWNCSDVDRLDSIQIMSFSREKLDFPTQKNKALLARIINASSPPGGLVLDCFAGSGTTAAVAQKLGRRWIACDINKGAVQTTVRRLQSIILEQVDAVRDSSDPAVGGPMPADLTFRVYEVHDSVLPLPAGQPQYRADPQPSPVTGPGQPPVRATLSVQRSDTARDRIWVEVSDFYSAAIVDRLLRQAEEPEPPLDDWRAMVDSIAIDVAYDGQTFNVALADLPERRIDLVHGWYELEAPAGHTTVAVRITDVLGEELLLTCSV